MKRVLPQNSLKEKFSALKFVIILVISMGLCACQNTPQQPKPVGVTNTVNFGQYYLGLKQLSTTDLQQEVVQQQAKKLEGSIEATVNLILLYSLPNSPIYSVYTAKALLNEQMQSYQRYYFSVADQAFIRVLNDQLNQQLFLMEKLVAQDLAHQEQQDKQQVIDKKRLSEIAELESTVTQLTQQIKQLKKIEQAINEHGQ